MTSPAVTKRLAIASLVASAVGFLPLLGPVVGENVGFLGTSPPLLLVGGALLVLARRPPQSDPRRGLAGLLLAVGVVGVLLALLFSGALFSWGRTHNAVFEGFVRDQATRDQVRAVKGAPRFVATPSQRGPGGRDLAAMWPMSENSRRQIDENLGRYAETWVYESALVDFLFFDTAGRVAAYESISN